MGKTFRRDKSFRPKSHGRTYNKDFQPWKAPKKAMPPKDEPPEELKEEPRQ